MTEATIPLSLPSHSLALPSDSSASLSSTPLSTSTSVSTVVPALVPPPVDVAKTQPPYYEPEHILGEKNEKHQAWVLVQWKGYPNEKDWTWEIKRKFKDSQLLTLYEQRKSALNATVNNHKRQRELMEDSGHLSLGTFTKQSLNIALETVWPAYNNIDKLLTSDETNLTKQIEQLTEMRENVRKKRKELDECKTKLNSVKDLF